MVDTWLDVWLSQYHVSASMLAGFDASLLHSILPSMSDPKVFSHTFQHPMFYSSDWQLLFPLQHLTEADFFVDLS
jgi:hypothetical protein